MPENTCLHLPWLSLSVFLPLLMAASVWRLKDADQARRRGITALASSSLTLLGAVLDAQWLRGDKLSEPLPTWAQWFVLDALNTIPLPLFAALALGVIALAPKRKVTPQWVAGVLLLTAMTLLTYATSNLVLLLIGWIGSLLPFLTSRFFAIKGEKELPILAKAVLSGSSVMLLAGIALMSLSLGGNWLQGLSLSVPRIGQSPVLYGAFSCLMLAVILRKGLLPAHSWVLSAYERGPLLPLTLLVNGHLGAFLIARVAIPLLPDVANVSLPFLGDFGLLTAAYTTLLALVEKQPRRLLALLSISQASFILTGLESTNPDAIAGALVHWQVVAVATTMLAAVYTALEARIGSTLESGDFLGLASHAPRLAVFFIVGGLALVGLPLTLGFCAEDLLLHGTLETHLQLGIVLPIVTALNAFHVLRLFARLFLGRPTAAVRGLSDALPRERWVLTLALLFLLIGGLRPNLFVQAPSAAAEKIIAFIHLPQQTAQK
jgi:NADH-quinone oxidoreductase subunit M